MPRPARPAPEASQPAARRPPAAVRPTREEALRAGAGGGSADRRSRVGSLETRTPRWTCGARVTGSSLSPTAPTGAPSSTASPRETVVARSCTSVTAEPVGRLDRDAAPHARERAREGHRPRRGRADAGTCAAADVDAAVLAGGVRGRRRARTAEGQGLRTATTTRWRPARGRARRRRRARDGAWTTSGVVSVENETITVAAAVAVVKMDYSERR